MVCLEEAPEDGYWLATVDLWHYDPERSRFCALRAILLSACNHRNSVSDTSIRTQHNLMLGESHMGSGTATAG